MPRKFDEKEIIYEENDEVPEMYFITSGTVGVGFMTLEKEFQDVKHFRQNTYINAYNVCSNIKCDFRYQSLMKTKTYALKKAFLSKLFDKYPKIAGQIKQDQMLRHKLVIKEPIWKEKEKYAASIKDPQ